MKKEIKINDNEALRYKVAELEEKLKLLLVEKDKRAAELLIANKELIFQTGEKADRSAELVIADKELVFQSGEKADRAAELLIANKELKFQNEEKDKRAAELIIVNKKLALQNIEKEKIILEIAELKDAQLFVEKQLFEKTLLSIGDGVISTDMDKNILFMNRSAETLTGWTEKDAIGKPIYSVFNIMNELTRRNDAKIIEKVIKTKSIHNLANHTILTTKSGKENLIEDSAAPIFDKRNNVVGVVIVFRDYTEKWNRLKKIEYLNFHDDLTGLYNRRFFEEELKRLDVKHNFPISIIMGDINGLKLINDSFGHIVGDELLQKTAATLKKECREDEIIARLGGDEFVIILPKCNLEQTKLVVKRIRNNLKDKSVNKLEISVAFGYGCKTDANQDIQEVLRQSEDSMYKNKLFEGASMRSKTIDLISEALFEKSERELSHSKRVSESSVKLAERLGLESDQIESIRLFGMMHDIGKIGIDEKILNKKGLLDEDEYTQIKKHPEIGFRILCSIKDFLEISTAVLQHHERWDGNGYPQGLKGEEILIEARIIALADTFDAITTERTYRSNRSRSEAIEEIVRCSGTQFDPKLTKVFVDMMSEDIKV